MGGDFNRGKLFRRLKAEGERLCTCEVQTRRKTIEGLNNINFPDMVLRGGRAIITKGKGGKKTRGLPCMRMNRKGADQKGVPSVKPECSREGLRKGGKTTNLIVEGESVGKKGAEKRGHLLIRRKTFFWELSWGKKGVGSVSVKDWRKKFSRKRLLKKVGGGRAITGKN